MRRAVNRRVLHAKAKAQAPQPRQIMAGTGSVGTIYNQIVTKGGKGRFCVIRSVGGIGDVVMALPLLKQLKTEFPNIHLTFAIDMHTTGNNVYYEMCKNLPYINELVDARYVERNKYDGVIDISSVCIRYEHSGLPTLNRIDIFARAAGVPKMASKLPEYIIEPAEKAWADVRVRALREKGKKLVVLHTASMEGKRCWPIEKYVEIVERAEKLHPNVHFLILDFNRKYASWDKFQNVSNFSSTTLREMTALISVCDLFIGPDSGPMHLAGAIQKSSIVLFGSIPPEARINYYSTHEAVRLEGLPCLGCWYKPCPFNEKCMKDLPSSKVYDRMLIRLGIR
jgi:ADP-heptose:LPS heptosyltransferase